MKLEFGTHFTVDAVIETMKYAAKHCSIIIDDILVPVYAHEWLFCLVRNMICNVSGGYQVLFDVLVDVAWLVNVDTWNKNNTNLL